MEREKVISIVPGLTQWSVRERDLENPIAYFTTCGEAIKYAKAIAETKRVAVVRILDNNGDTTLEQHFGPRAEDRTIRTSGSPGDIPARPTLSKDSNMETIIAGRFETLAAAQQAEAMLIGLEFADDDICSFALNPPGQHDTCPMGGDAYADDNSRNAGAGAAKGGAIGGAIGLGTGLAAAAAIPPAGAAVAIVAAAAGAGVGAYTGSLAGALNNMGKDRQENTSGKPQESRPAGVLVAVRVEGKTAELSAEEAFRETGASAVEIASGTWRDGTWADFNPQSAPTPLR